MRFVCVCNPAGILGVSNSHTFQNEPCVPPHPTPPLTPSFFPSERGRRVMEVKCFVQINNEPDTTLSS